MKLRGFLFFIILPVLLTAIFLMPSSANYLGIASFLLAFVGLVLGACSSRPVISCLFVVIATQWIQLEGSFLSMYLLAFAAVVLLFIGVVKSEVKADFHWFLPLLIMLSYLAIIILKHPYVVNMLLHYVNVVVLILFAAVSLYRWDSVRIQQFLSANILFMIVWAFIEYFFAYTDRVTGPPMSSTNFAAMITVAWAIWLTNAWLSKQVKPFWLLIVSVLVCVSVVFSGSRMGFIGIASGGAMAIAFYFLQNLRSQILPVMGKMLVIFVVFVVLVALFWMVLPDDILIKKGISLLLNGKLDQSSLGRVMVWLTALDTIKKYPIWGCGQGNFYVISWNYLEQFKDFPLGRYIPRLGHAHNIYLKVLSEDGIVGCIALGSVCLLCFRELFLHIRNQWDCLGFALLNGMIVLMILGVVDVFPLFPSSLSWGAWIMGVMFSLRVYRKHER